VARGHKAHGRRRGEAACGPLARLFPARAWTAWLLRHRRVFGLAAFGYGVVHLVVFSASIGRLDWIVEGMAYASMWTGWLAFVLLLLIAAISNAPAMARLGRWWKRLQRLAYPAALLTLAHWLLLSTSPVEALLHAVPVASLWTWIAANQLFGHVGSRRI
jgi:methionine sulfoxide reductase heme-binding subunit